MRARHCLIFGKEAQQWTKEGKGTIIAYDQVPCISALRAEIPNFAGRLTEGLLTELNKYYDPKNTGIGRHGDGERRIVVCARLGYSFPLLY